MQAVTQLGEAKEKMRTRAFAVLAATAASLALVFLSFPVFGGVASAAVPEFPQCPAIGHDTGCEFLITLPATGPATIQQDTTQGPYDGNDDTLVGIVNDTGFPI
ncbi:MAG TPA: hypothetical protein VIY26_13795, partial [Acidimicrobiales bacterium]